MEPTNNRVAMETNQWTDGEFGILAGSLLFDDEDNYDVENLEKSAGNDPFGLGMWFPSTNQQNDEGEESRLVSPPPHLGGLMSIVGQEWSDIPTISETFIFAPPRYQQEKVLSGQRLISVSRIAAENNHEAVTTSCVAVSDSVKSKGSVNVQSDHKSKPMPLLQSPLLPRVNIPSVKINKETACGALAPDSHLTPYSETKFVPISPSSSMSSNIQSLEQVAAMMKTISRPVFISCSLSGDASYDDSVATRYLTSANSLVANNDLSNGKGNNTKKRKSSYGPQEEDMEERHRRERNRFMAKRTRDRKKMTFSHLKEELLELAQENKMLKGFVQNHALFRSPQHRQAILDQCTAMTQIPKQAWDACETHANGVQEEAAATDILGSLTTTWDDGSSCSRKHISLANITVAPAVASIQKMTPSYPKLILPKGTVPDPLHSAGFATKHVGHKC